MLTKIHKGLTVLLALGVTFAGFALIAPVAQASGSSDDYSFDYSYDSGSTRKLSDEEAQAVAGTMGVFSIVIIVVSCVATIIWIAVTVWVYKDASKNSDSPVLWALLTFFFGLLGLLIYFFAGRKKKAA